MSASGVWTLGSGREGGGGVTADKICNVLLMVCYLHHTVQASKVLCIMHIIRLKLGQKKRRMKSLEELSLWGRLLLGVFWKWNLENPSG